MIFKFKFELKKFKKTLKSLRESRIYSLEKRKK